MRIQSGCEIQFGKKEECVMKGIALYQKNMAKRDCYKESFSIEACAASHIGGFWAPVQNRMLSKQHKHTEIFDQWVEKTLYKYLEHHPWVASAALFVLLPIEILAMVFCTMLVVYPIGMLCGWL